MTHVIAALVLVSLQLVPSAPVGVGAPRPAAAPAYQIDGARWRQAVVDLAGFGTRYVGTDGCLAARDYVEAQFLGSGLQVSTPRFSVRGEEAFNVVGELPGNGTTSDIVVVGAHYDSTSEQPRVAAPGAEDNASGVAGLIELARVLSTSPPAATIRFVAFSGEEAGLFGSRDYVDRLMTSGESGRVRAVVNMDMIGYSGDDDLDVLLESDESGKDLMRVLSDAAAGTGLRIETSLNPFGSDHVPFIQAGIPAVLVIENDWDSYPGYHRSSDTPEKLRVEMGVPVLRMVAGAIADLADGVDEPRIASVRWARKAAGPQLVVNGRFAWETSQIQVNGVPLDATIFREKFRDGDTTRRIIGRDADLEALVPKNVEVIVRVVDLRTGTATADFPLTR
jgi:hypothetical protein